MQAFGILLALGLAAIAFVLPIIAMVAASNARRTAEQNANRLLCLEGELALVKRRLAESAETGERKTETTRPAPAVTPPPAAMAEASPPPSSPVFAGGIRFEPVVTSAPTPPEPLLPQPEPPPPAVPPPLPAFAREQTQPLPTVAAPRLESRPTPPPVPPSLPPEPAPPINWEQFLGVKFFAWAGGIALAITAIFFLQYSFEHGWIPESVRAAMAFVAGAGLLVGGLWSIRRDYAVTGQSLCATGILVLYAVTFACRAYYEFPFFTAIPTFLLMTLITATAFLLAVRLNAQVVAILGLVGGFLTPVLINTGHDNPAGLFGYVALLDLGLLAVALHRRWDHLTVLAALGTVATQIGWAATFPGLHNLPTTGIVCIAFSALFAAAVALARRLARGSDWLAAAALLPPVTALGFALYFVSQPELAAHPGWILGSVLFADLALLAVAALHRRVARLHVFAGLAAFGVAALWISLAATSALLPWVFGFIVLAAAQHGLFPFVLARLQPGADSRQWSALFPPVGLIVLLLPLARFAEVGWWIWPVVLLLDVFALAAAAATRLLSALAGAVVLTLLVLGLAIGNLPPHSPAGGLELGLIAGFALFFCGGSLWLLRRFFAQPSAGETGVAEPAWLAQLPGVSAALPFVLLGLLVFKLQLPDPSEVFGVALLLIALLLGLAAVARQGALVLAAFAGTLLLEYAWFGEWFPQGSQSVGLLWFAGFAALFLAYPFTLRNRLLGTQAPWAVAALALPLHFHLILRGVDALWPHHGVPGLLAAVCALPPLAGLLTLLRTVPATAPFRLNRLAWFGAATLFFITLVFPLQFSLQWITLSWALEGAALLWLFHRIPHPGLRVTGVGLLCVVFVRLVFNSAVLGYGAPGHWVVFNWILYTYGLAALCCFAGMKLLAPPRHLVLGVNAPPVLATLGTVLTFVLVNLEIADAFTPAGAGLHLAFSGHFTRDMSYPIAWSLFALALVVLGVRRGLSLARYAGVALLGAVLVRLVLSPPVLESGARGGTLVAAWLLATYGVAAACCYAGARFLAREDDRVGPVTAKALLATLGTVFLFVLVNLVIADHFAPVGQRLRLEFSGSFARDMSYTIAWALFAIGLLVAGIRRQLAPARYAAIALLCVTFLKLIFHDFAELDQIYRIAAFFVAAVVAIAASFLYQRFFRASDRKQP